MSVPEATMDQHHGFMPWKDNIGAAWQRCVMTPEPEAKLVKAGAHDSFRTSVATSNARHIPTAPIGAYAIHTSCGTSVAER
jgi:hypothetical protein